MGLARGEVSVSSLMVPSNQATLNATGKSQIGSSAEIPGHEVGNIMLLPHTSSQMNTPLDELLPPLGRKIPR